MNTRRSLGSITTVLAALTLVTATAYAADMTGTAGNDHLTGTASADTLRGLAGDDHLDGRRGPDRLVGGTGNDEIVDYLGIATGGPLSLTRDVYRGGPGRDTLHVGRNDVVHAGGGRDHVWAYYVGEGDLVDCGAGSDTLHLHEDLHGLETRGCEQIVIRLAG
jgi:Ca2+-binding RTX toxin-like protein